MKKGLCLVLLFSLIQYCLIAQVKPSFSIIGTKEKVDGSPKISCLYVQAINYDANNPKHFEFIRKYIREKAGYAPDDYVAIYIFDRKESMDSRNCGDSHNNVELIHLIAAAYMQGRAADHNNKRLISLEANSVYGYDGTGLPKGVRHKYSDDDSSWF